MSQGLEVDVKGLLLSPEALTHEKVEGIIKAIRENFSVYRLMREGVGELEMKLGEYSDGNMRLGIGYYLIGRFHRAEEYLRLVGPNSLALYYLAKSCANQGKHEEALVAFKSAVSAGFSRDLCELGRADSLRQSGKVQEALSILDSLSGAVEQTAEYLYQRGTTVAQLGGNPTEVIALYERAVEANPNHSGALFGLARENDRSGNDEQALDLYARSAKQVPTHVGSLLNLGLMYEDLNQYDKAAQCYQRILDVYPDHPRARLYMKDSRSSTDMFYDEDAQKKKDKLSQILGIPVTDFELSVRSRNCLQKMGVMTLGDLTRTTEQELLASKNFGETSLMEIKEMLTSKGLSLGMLAHERRDTFEVEQQQLSPDEQALLNKPISDLNLSVRARKCMVRLGISTIGDLVRKTGDELLECKNFGVTSLNEVREKLTAHAIKLRGD